MKKKEESTYSRAIRDALRLSHYEMDSEELTVIISEAIHYRNLAILYKGDIEKRKQNPISHEELFKRDSVHESRRPTVVFPDSPTDVPDDF